MIFKSVEDIVAFEGSNASRLRDILYFNVLRTGGRERLAVFGVLNDQR